MTKASSPIDKSIAPDLPAAPSLDTRWLKWQGVRQPEGLLEAFLPATPAFCCSTPEAPALVCIPGLGMDGSCFIRQLPLGCDADLHLLRMPGYAAKGEKGMGHFACYVERYVREMGLERRGVILLGSSMGGAVALTVAARRNIDVRGLILDGSFGHYRHLNPGQHFLTRISWVLPRFLIRLMAGPVMRRTKAFGQFTEPEIAFMRSCLRLPSQGYLVRAANALRRLDLLGSARSLTVPTLVLHGTDDRVLPFEAGRELAEAIPDARLIPFQDAGHAHFFLDHEAVNVAILGFMRELSQTPLAGAQTA